MDKVMPAPRRSRTLELVDELGQRIRAGQLPVGQKLPPEAAVMAEFGVSRTVVREAISRLQAAGWITTKHGVGSFVCSPGESPFCVTAQQLQTLREVVALLELRIGIETEAAALAAQRRTTEDLQEIADALEEFDVATEAGGDAVGPDYRFHVAVARATGNAHFVNLLSSLSAGMIPRARLGSEGGAASRDDLRHVNAEHRAIFDAIAAQDASTARAAMRVHLTNSLQRKRLAMN